MTHPDERIMKELIAYTRARAVANQTFTGALIIKNGTVISKAVTTMVPDRNPLAHAEMKVLNESNKILDGDLSECHLYTTQKPCLMCASAALWSKISTVTYGWDTQLKSQKRYRAEEFLAEFGVKSFGPILDEEVKEIDKHLLIENEA